MRWEVTTWISVDFLMFWMWHFAKFSCTSRHFKTLLLFCALKLRNQPSYRPHVLYWPARPHQILTKMDENTRQTHVARTCCINTCPWSYVHFQRLRKNRWRKLTLDRQYMLSFGIVSSFASGNDESFLTDRKSASNQAWLPNNKLVKQLRSHCGWHCSGNFGVIP